MNTVTIDPCPRCGGKHVQSVDLSLADPALNQINFRCPERTRFLKLVNFSFDFSRNTQEHQPTSDSWFVANYGASDLSVKRKRWGEASASNMWIFKDYREKINEVTTAYIMGNFFAAITSAVCLVERALNILVIRLKLHHAHPPKYAKILARNSHIRNWEACWVCLREWGEIDDAQVKLVKKIHRIRNDVCHYHPEFDYSKEALSVIGQVNELFDSIFGVFNRTDIFHIFTIPGEIWVKEAAQSTPFVKSFVALHCLNASAKHRFIDKVYHEFDTEFTPLTEAEFIEQRIVFNQTSPSDSPHIVQHLTIAGRPWELRII